MATTPKAAAATTPKAANAKGGSKFGISAVGEGFNNPNQDPEKAIPIDIQCYKLLDWLVDRRKCTKEWKQEVDIVRSKIHVALGNLPHSASCAAELRDIIGEETILTYWHVQRILDLLKGSDVGTRNLLGQYTNENIQEWTAIIKLYEEKGAYLAEAAHMLMTSAKYDVAQWRRNIDRAGAALTKLDKTEHDNAVGAAKALADYRTQCQRLGVPDATAAPAYAFSTDLTPCIDALRALPAALPELYAEVVRKVQTKDVRDACDHYRDFVTYLLHDEAGDAAAAAGDEESIAEPSPKAAGKGKGKKGGGKMTTPTAAATPATPFVFDRPLPSLNAVYAHGNETVAARNAREGAAGGATPAAADETVLENVTTRNAFLDDAFELQAFLTQRIQEVTTVSGELAVGSGDKNVEVSADTLQRFLKAVNGVITAANSPRAQQLLLIKISKRYVTRLAGTLHSKLAMHHNLTHAATDVDSKRAQLQADIVENRRRLQATIALVRELQQNLQLAISKLFFGRPVNIQGEVNTLE